MRENARRRQIEECLAVRHIVADRVRAGAPADGALAAVFRAARRYGSRDRRFFAAAVFAEFRWLGWIQRIEDVHTRLALALALDGEIDHARAFAPDLQEPPPGGLLEKAAWFDRFQPGGSPARIEDLVPAWTFDEIPHDGAPDFPLRLIESLQTRPPLWLRARRGQSDAIIAHLRAAGFDCAADARVPDAVRVNGAPSADVLRPLLHRAAEIQDIASQQVGLFCAPRNGEHWWDVCAGAGGKALHLMEQLNGTGHVLCTDIRARALDELARRATAAGYANWSIRTTTALPPDVRFDGILIDAPCSGTGTWNRAPDARWRTDRSALAAHRDRQRTLVQTALAHLKPHGRLVYAVCSLTRTETLDVVDHIHRHTRAQPDRPLRIDPFSGPGIGMWCVVFHQR